MRFKKNIPAILSFRAKKVKGGALYIALIISILVSITLCLFIFIARYNQRTVTVYSQSSQLYHNLQGAFEVARSAGFTDEYNNRWIKNTTNDDSIKVSRHYWGAYLLVSATTKNRHEALFQSGLYGTYMSRDTGLIVADNSRPVGVSGPVVFRSNCFLPRAGIRPAYIEGQSYTGNAANGAFTKFSPGQLPLPHRQFVAGMEQQRMVTGNDSIVAVLPANISRSFHLSTIACQVTASKLNHTRLKNNIKLMAQDIEIDSSCHFDNILIVCKKIRFKEGFKGRVHVIASDSIITEKKCVFAFPSSFVLLPEEGGTALRYIQLNEGCTFFGGILALDNGSNTSGKGPNVFVKLHATSEVNGLVYSAGYMHVEGQLNATVMCNTLLLKTPSAVYENHLLGCVIDPGKYAGFVAIPSLFKQRAAWVCCERTDQDRCRY